MNRAQMIEKGAQAHYREAMPDATIIWPELSHKAREHHRQRAAAVIDAALPQVTTVEELEALPIATQLVTEDGETDNAGYWAELARSSVADGVTQYFWPLTLVWQP